MKNANHVGIGSRLITTFAIAVCALVGASSARAQVWTEIGDAGPIVATAQVPLGTGALITIDGTLGASTDADVYAVQMLAVAPTGLPLIQSQCTVNQGPNIFLFDATGKGVFTTSICGGGNKTILAPLVALPVGTYYVAIAFSGLDPQSAAGPIWLSFLSPQHAPDGAGAAQALTGWSGTPLVQPVNPYPITLGNMGYVGGTVPTRRSKWSALKLRYR